MAAEVLPPQICFVHRLRVPPTACPRRRCGGGIYTPDGPYACNNNRFNRRPEQRKRDDLKSVRHTEKVSSILRRGESLMAAAGSDTYAGSAFAVSPSPSSLPLPSFSKKKQILVDDSASRDLRRLLRLEI